MISNNDYETALKDENNIKMMFAASKPFYRRLTKDELESCRLSALMNALNSYNPKKSSFLTYLYSYVRWECLNQMNFNSNKQNKPLQLDEKIDIPDKKDFFEKIDCKDLLTILSENQKKVINQYFIDNLTLREIAEKNGYSHQTAKNYIESALENLKRELKKTL